VSTGPVHVPRKNAHTATPKGGTYAREADGKPARLANRGDYPVTAECAICHGLIRLGFFMQWEWQHAPVKVPAPAPPTEGTA
jgi:hypothetical protein